MGILISDTGKPVAVSHPHWWTSDEKMKASVNEFMTRCHKHVGVVKDWVRHGARVYTENEVSRGALSHSSAWRGNPYTKEGLTLNVKIVD